MENIIPWIGHKSELVLSVLKFSSGDTAIYKCVWNRPSPWSVTVSTPDIHYEFKPLEVLNIRTFANRSVEIIEEDLNIFKPGFFRQADDLIRLFKNESTNAIGMEEAFKTMNIISLIYDF